MLLGPIEIITHFLFPCFSRLLLLIWRRLLNSTGNLYSLEAMFSLHSKTGSSPPPHCSILAWRSSATELFLCWSSSVAFYFSIAAGLFHYLSRFQPSKVFMMKLAKGAKLLGTWAWFTFNQHFLSRLLAIFWRNYPSKIIFKIRLRKEVRRTLFKRMEENLVLSRSVWFVRITLRMSSVHPFSEGSKCVHATNPFLSKFYFYGAVDAWRY